MPFRVNLSAHSRPMLLHLALTAKCSYLPNTQTLVHTLCTGHMHRFTLVRQCTLHTGAHLLIEPLQSMRAIKSVCCSQSNSIILIPLLALVCWLALNWPFRERPILSTPIQCVQCPPVRCLIDVWLRTSFHLYTTLLRPPPLQRTSLTRKCLPL